MVVFYSIEPLKNLLVVFLSLNSPKEITMAEKKNINEECLCFTCEKYELVPLLAECECKNAHTFCVLCQASWQACPQCVAVASSSSLNVAAPSFLPQKGNNTSMENAKEVKKTSMEEMKVKESGDNEDEESDPNNMYSKVDKVKKKSYCETKSNLGARPKQRSPQVPAPGLESVDYSEYEVSHTDRRTEQPLFNMARSYNDHEFRGRPDPNYETLPPYADSQLPQKQDPGYESVKPPSSGLDPGYEIAQTSRGQRSGPRSFPPEYESVSRDRDPGYESVGGFRDPGYETVPFQRAASLEPGYETLPERAPSSPSAPAPSSETVYSVVNKKQRAAPAATLPPGKLNREVSDEEGYETIPGDKNKHSGLQEYDPGYEELPPVGAGVSRVRDPEYETIAAKPVRERLAEADTDGAMERLKDADIEFIDESADELEDGLAELKSGR